MKPWTTLTERARGPAMTLSRLSSDGTALYWVSCPGLTKPCTLFRLAHDASKPTALITTASLRTYALDATDVYVAAGDRIVRVAKLGGPPTRIADASGAYQLAIAGDRLYLSIADTRNLEGPSSNPRPGQIVRIPKAGGAPTVLVEHTSTMPRLAIDDHRIYFTTNHGILAMELAGDSTVELARDQHNSPGGLALDDEAVYFSAGGEVRRVAKAGGDVTVLYRAQIVLDVRTHGGAVYAARNLAYDRGEIAERAAIVKLSGGRTDVLAELDGGPTSFAVDSGGVYAVLVQLGASSGNSPDRVVALSTSR